MFFFDKRIPAELVLAYQNDLLFSIPFKPTPCHPANCRMTPTVPYRSFFYDKQGKAPADYHLHLHPMAARASSTGTFASTKSFVLAYTFTSASSKTSTPFSQGTGGKGAIRCFPPIQSGSTPASLLFRISSNLFRRHFSASSMTV